MVSAQHRHLISQKSTGSPRQLLASVALMLFFFAVFDGILCYLFPIIITHSGISPALMGIIISSSSIAGAIFDLALSKFLTKIHFRRLYLVTLILGSLISIILWQARTTLVFVLVMVIWGLYYDLFTFSNFDFVSHATAHHEHALSFSVIDTFKAFGYFLAPLTVAFLVIKTVDIRSFIIAWLLLLATDFFYILVVLSSKKRKRSHFQPAVHPQLDFFSELRLWRHLGRQLSPILIFGLLLNTFDSFFWTIGPLYSEFLIKKNPLGVMLLPAYSLPTLIVSWFVGKLTSRHGKKRTAFATFFLGSLCLGLMIFSPSPILAIMIVFLSSILSSSAWPAIGGTYADYISETTKVEREIEALADFFANLGYILGPIMAGILAGFFGYDKTFAILGIVCASATLVIARLTPREVNIKVPRVRGNRFVSS